MSYYVKILKDSCNSLNSHRLTTMEVCFPRIILSEFNTHRVFSRNSASSRAIPVEKRIAAIEKDPFIPSVFGKNQSGMVAHQNLSDDSNNDAKNVWMSALQSSIASAKQLVNLDVHKQLANRLLEPFCWQTVIVTSTEWGNFFGLRCHTDAQPEIKTIADMMLAAYTKSTPEKLDLQQWHLPLLQDDEYSSIGSTLDLEEAKLISVGRCARVSYLTHDGKRDIQADIKLAARLQESGHMSPFEHVATPWSPVLNRNPANFQGWVQLRRFLDHESNYADREQK